MFLTFIFVLLSLKQKRYELEEKISQDLHALRDKALLLTCVLTRPSSVQLYIVLYEVKLVELYIHAHPPVSIALQND